MKNWKDLIIEDQIETIQRLNAELSERIEFEKRLIEIIRKFQGD